MNRYKEIPTLLSKVLLGGLSKEEEVRLRAWRGKSVENEHLYHEVIKRGFVEKKCQEVSRVNIVDGYMNVIRKRWKSHATLTLLATQDLPTFGYNMIDPLKSWCWGSILFYPFKISRFS